MFFVVYKVNAPYVKPILLECFCLCIMRACFVSPRTKKAQLLFTQLLVFYLFTHKNPPPRREIQREVHLEPQSCNRKFVSKTLTINFSKSDTYE